MRTIRTLYPGGKSKAVTFSYDDGVNFDRRMVRILNQCGMKGSFNLSSGLLTGEKGWPTRDKDAMIRYINAEDVAEVYEGHEVAIHGFTHPFWTAIPKELALQEMLQDKIRLEQLVGYPVRGMAYPFFSYNEDIREIAKALGIRYARGSGREHYFQLPVDPLLFFATCHHNDPDLAERAAQFVKEGFNTNAIFCLSGHSFEFANDHNWQVLEDFCDFIKGREEIWYATCIDIFDYIAATKALRYTSDCSIVQNPTALEIWLLTDHKTISVKPGETVRL